MLKNCAPFVEQFGIQNLIISNSFKFSTPLEQKKNVRGVGNFFWGGAKILLAAATGVGEVPGVQKMDICTKRYIGQSVIRRTVRA